MRDEEAVHTGRGREGAEEGAFMAWPRSRKHSLRPTQIVFLFIQALLCAIIACTALASATHFTRNDRSPGLCPMGAEPRASSRYF
jgi:hypothetical protein